MAQYIKVQDLQTNHSESHSKLMCKDFHHNKIGLCVCYFSVLPTFSAKKSELNSTFQNYQIFGTFAKEVSTNKKILFILAPKQFHEFNRVGNTATYRKEATFNPIVTFSRLFPFLIVLRHPSSPLSAICKRVSKPFQSFNQAGYYTTQQSVAPLRNMTLLLFVSYQGRLKNDFYLKYRWRLFLRKCISSAIFSVLFYKHVHFPIR